MYIGRMPFLFSQPSVGSITDSICQPVHLSVHLLIIALAIVIVAVKLSFTNWIIPDFLFIPGSSYVFVLLNLEDVFFYSEDGLM